jgi:NitT/TauT family transport system permease protein
MKRNIVKKIFLPFIPFIAFLVLWQWIASSKVFLPSLLPTPIDVVHAFFELLQNGVLFEHAISSLFRVLTGFFLAAFVAIPLGMFFGWYRNLGFAFSPFIEMFRTISPIAWIPLAILWLGIGDRPAIFIIFITSFFPILIATMHAIKQIDPSIIKTAINFGAHGTALLYKVIFPASFPYIMVGLRIALGVAWVIIVAAEMVGMQSGLGFLILDGRNLLRTDIIMAGMVSVGLIGFLLDKLMYLLTRRFEKHQNRVEHIWK